MTDPLSDISTRQTPQSEQAHPAQVRNSDGHFSFKVTDEQRALRFLILGSDGGSYYASEKDLTKDNAQLIIGMAATNHPGKELVELIRDVSLDGRASKQNPTIFALAVCAASPDQSVRKAALAALNDVCRTATQLFMFVRYVKQFRGWGDSLKHAVADWYLSKDVDKLAYQMVKYRQREGYTHRDILRLTHAKPAKTDHKRRALFNWAAGHGTDEGFVDMVAAYEAAQKIASPDGWIPLINGYGLPWEALPDAALTHREVWEALLPSMGITALIRNLPRLTKLHVLAPLGTGNRTSDVVKTLTDLEAIRKGRVHPLNLLTALVTYQSGHGLKGGMTWDPVPKIVDALDTAFYLSFGALAPANKSTLLALDVSASMTWETIARSPLTPRTASAAMAMTAVRTEPDVMTTAFSQGGSYGARGPGIEEVPLTGRQRLDDVVRTIEGMWAGGTDCALPMLWATRNRLQVDTFVIYTDSETNSGSIHPHQALEQYRQWSGRPARLVVVGMVSNGFTVANPDDAGEMDVVGFDSASPELIRGFSAGEF